MIENYAEKIYQFVSGFAKQDFLSEDEIINYFIKKVPPMIRCLVATFFDVDESRKVITVRKSTGPVSQDITGISFGYEGVVGWCARNRKALLINDVAHDSRFSNKVDMATGFETKNIIAVPCLYMGNLLGVVEIINSPDNEFVIEDLQFVEILVSGISPILYIKRLEQTIKQLSLKGENTINNLSGGFIGVDMDSKIIFFNPKAKEIFELEQDYLNKNILDFQQVSPNVVDAIANVLKSGQTVRRQEFKCVINGKTKVIGYSSINIKGVDGAIIGAGIIFQDITNL